MDNLLPHPNLIIMGAQKSGTTSLYEYIRKHPDIFMSNPVKEPGFYLGEERAKIFWRKMGKPIASRTELLTQRMLLGYNEERWFGDASTYYTLGKRSRLFNIPSRMHEQDPQMKFIYIVRNPIERIISNYKHIVERGKTKETLQDFLQTPEGENSILTSLYSWQISPYLELFPRKQFLFLIFEEFLSNPHKGMEKVWNFLDLAPPAEPIHSFHAYNASALKTPQTDKEHYALNILQGSAASRVMDDIKKFENIIDRQIDKWKTLLPLANEETQ